MYNPELVQVRQLPNPVEGHDSLLAKSVNRSSNPTLFRRIVMNLGEIVSDLKIEIVLGLRKLDIGHIDAIVFLVH